MRTAGLSVLDRGEELERGNSAEQVLTNPIFNEAWVMLEAELVKTLRDAPFDDIDGLKNVKITLRLLERLKSVFIETMQTGKMAALQLSDKEVRRDG
jgi:hypothetical protein